MPWIALLGILLAVTLPRNNVKGSPLAKMKMIDWAGLGISIVATILLLVRTIDQRTISRYMHFDLLMAVSGSIVSRWL